MRKLTSIQRILSVDPIQGADAIEVATVLGWHVVVKKSDGFRQGDLVVYIEVDSVLPDRPEFEFMKPRGMRVKTVRLRGQVSQGIAFPLSILSNVDVFEGMDVTEYLGITKWDPPMPQAAEAKGVFPSFIPKTDETRIQSVPGVLVRNADVRCAITEKLDGTSVTAWIKDSEFGVASRTLELREGPSAYWQAVRNADIEEKLRRIGRNVALQGELLGPGIQSNKYKLAKPVIYWFNMFDIDAFAYYGFDAASQIMDHLGLQSVPWTDEVMLGQYTVDNYVEMASAASALAKTPREGIVVRPLREMSDPELGRLSFKVINPDFLLKHNE